jgi:hypothetical protein
MKQLLSIIKVKMVTKKHGLSCKLITKYGKDYLSFPYRKYWVDDRLFIGIEKSGKISLIDYGYIPVRIETI